MGVMLFMFKDEHTKKDGDDPLLGNILIAISLLMDGLCGASQDRMRSAGKPAPLNFMIYVNLWSLIYLLMGMVVSNEGPKFVTFITKHPEILRYIGMAVVVTSFGQIFISAIVTDFGSLALSLTTTTRKIFSVCLSVIIFCNHLSYWQWGAASLIFGALIVDVFLNKAQQNDIVEKENLGDVKIADVSKTISEVKTLDEKEIAQKNNELWVIDIKC